MRSNKLEAGSGSTRARSFCVVLLAFSGAYVNALFWGFRYGGGNQEFELALVNWLRDPTLYPGDPITEAFARFPSSFWPAVAYLSSWMSTEQVLFLFFLVTKALFFLALVELVFSLLKDWRLVACIVFSVAFSPFLNKHTPFGSSDILNAIQTNTSLAVALLLCVSVFLVEGRWTAAALLCGLATYLNALFVSYSLFAFGVFAWLDWRQHKRKILLSALLGGALVLSWLALSPGVVPRGSPAGYVQALLAFYPFHHTLRSHWPYGLLRGAGLLGATLSMVVVASKAGLARERRLEWLTVSFFVPVLLGAIFGEFYLSPALARLQFLRADSFLVLYAFLLVQIYGGKLLRSAQSRRPKTTMVFGALAILLPLSYGLVTLPLFYIGLLLWSDPRDQFEAFCRRLANSNTRGSVQVAAPKFAAVILGVVAMAWALSQVPQASRRWNPVLLPKPMEADWREVQQWAKGHTPRDAHFLVPTEPSGFRVFSERPSWGEGRDGTAIYLYPPFAELYRQRMRALGIEWGPKWIDHDALQENYRRQSWDRLLTIARENNLSYIIQFRDVPYKVSPVFANHNYAVYKVGR